ncbi:SMI1/KNR4 family protein [Singulisphaera sp. Ch08]|uniref:SMI1/KNR4 family protein n=1 Tax=Singulisphaera sp. Ch08 TaxID=3120278 RepID=A0AAU7CHM1_9BACT
MGLPDDVRACFAGFAFGPPCSESEIRRAESELGETLPPVLRAMYLAFDGFEGPTGAAFFCPLFAHDEHGPGLVDMNLFYRGDDLFPQGLVSQCLFFGDGGGGPHWGIKQDVPGKVIHWVASWGSEFQVAGADPLEVWANEKRMYDELNGQEYA